MWGAGCSCLDPGRAPSPRRIVPLRVMPRLPPPSWPQNTQEASFREFLSRPENAAAVEKHQRKEARASVKAEERAALERLRGAVLDADFEAQRAVAPFLRTPVLRRVVQTFANDARGDFSAWAGNPRVVEMLAAAQRLLDTGAMSEGEMEAALLAQLKDPGHEAHAEFERKSRRVARLPTDALVGALNEHVRGGERRFWG